MPASQVLVSIVMPAHDAETTIGIALSSALNQTHKNIEVIVVDDGSQDSTASIVSAHTDPRINLVRQSQRGASSARNAGLRVATGDLVAFLDDDDFLMPTYLESALAAMPAGKWFVTANAYYMYPGGISPHLLRHHGEIPVPTLQRMALLQSNWVSIMSVFPMQMLQDIGEFDESLGRSEDWDFWLRAVFQGWRVAHQPRPLAIFDRTQMSQTSALRLVADAEAAIVMKMLSRSDLTSAERSYLERRAKEPHAGLLSHWTDVALNERNYRDAARYTSRAARLSGPRSMLRLKAAALGLAPRLSGPLLRARLQRRVTAGLTAPEVPSPEGDT